MAADIDIANLALSHVAADARVTSLDPVDPTVEALYCSRFLPIARDNLLEKHTWSFATKRALLSPVAFDEDMYPEWGYAYTLPANFMRCVGLITPTGLISPTSPQFSTERVVGFEGLFDYAIETVGSTSTLFCNLDEVRLRYVERVTDSTRYSSLFVTALAYELAGMLVGPLRKDPAMKREMAGLAMQAWMQASGVDSAGQTEGERARRNHTAPWHADR